MYLTDQPAAITVEAVTLTLNNLIHVTITPKDTPLLYLRIVADALRDARMMPTTDYRRFALERILTDLLTGHFHHLSALLRLAPPPGDEPYPDALVSITGYGKTGNPEMIGWCWLYYRYVRSELAISPEVFSRSCHITDRTLRRYQGVALARLTRLLMQVEWERSRLESRV